MARSIWTFFAVMVYNGIKQDGSEGLPLTGKTQLWNFLFPRIDSDDSSDFLLDKLQTNPYGIVYRDRDTQSHVRVYEPGTQTTITPPRWSEKTPITEKLNDSVIAGYLGNEPWGQRDKSLVGNILEQHIQAANMEKNKQAINMFTAGIFPADGEDGKDIGLDIDFSRSVGNSITYDFTAGGATMAEALTELQNAGSAAGVPLANQFAIGGDSWLTEFSTDTGVLEYLKTNRTVPAVPAQITETEGLEAVEWVKLPGMRTGIWVCSYEPGVPYRATESSSAGVWIAATDIIFGSMSDVRWTVNRGVDVLDESEKAVRAVGDIVFDMYTEKDPVNRFARSQGRHCFVPGEIDHTLKSTGTFA